MATERLKLYAEWSEVRERLKENNIELTDEDLQYEPGKENELLDRLQEKMKRTKAEIRILLESISYNKPQAS